MNINFNIKSCEQAKDVLSKIPTACTVWRNRFAPSNHIGNCINLYRKLKPLSVEDFYTKYVANAVENHNLPIKERGLTEEELLQLAANYKRLAEQYDGAPVWDSTIYLYDALCHIIVETWNGMANERAFKEYLGKTLPDDCAIGDYDGFVDGRYGVDIRVCSKGRDVMGIQIKPLSFFKSNRPDVRADRVRLCRKYINAMADMSIKTCYAIYVRDKVSGDVKWVRNNHGGFRFDIDDLFSFQPQDINGTLVSKCLPTVVEALP